MGRLKLKGGLERNVLADLWKNTLSQIPSHYGRLTYLASLRDQNSGVYKHHGLSSVFGREETSRALKESHERLFREWLNLPLEEKNADLRGYLESLDEPPLSVADFWLKSDQVLSLTPSSARLMERQLFRRDIEVLLDLLRNAAASPSSSPRP